MCHPKNITSIYFWNKIIDEYTNGKFELIKSCQEVVYQDGTNNHINFIADTFNVPIPRFKNILNMIIKNKYNCKWNLYIRCQYLDDKVTDLMKKSCYIEVFLGIEVERNGHNNERFESNIYGYT
jgi:hypothetical protein